MKRDIINRKKISDRRSGADSIICASVNKNKTTKEPVKEPVKAIESKRIIKGSILTSKKSNV